MEKLLEIMSKAKCSVTLEVNDHRDNYETVEQYFDGTFREDDKKEEIPDDIFAEMVKRDTIVCIRVYPHTPVGFVIFYHYDLNELLNNCLEYMVSQ
jgi:hypothetical protein